MSEDESRDFAIKIIEMIITELGWDVTDQEEEVWYPFDLAQASRLARSEGLAKAKAKQDVRLSRNNMMFDLGRAGFQQAMSNKSQTGDWRYSRGQMFEDKDEAGERRIGYTTIGSFGKKGPKYYPGG